MVVRLKGVFEMNPLQYESVFFPFIGTLSLDEEFMGSLCWAKQDTRLN